MLSSCCGHPAALDMKWAMVRRRLSKYVRLSTLAVWLLTVVTSSRLINAQTEGDTGYDYNDAYDDSYEEESGMEPNFDVPIVNVTVVAGQTAVLPCSIEHLGKYKVAWLDHNSIPLTYEDRRVVDDTRFTIVRPYTREWNLQVRDVRWDDQGQYRCTINTNPVKSKVIMLHVKVPATILDELSSDDVTVQEGDTIVLICNVTGVPQPEVTWYRRPATSKNTERERIGMTGEMIIIRNVSRYCDDIYECVASNGVPPSVSRQMRVTVEFAPEIQMQNRRLGQARGRETILECIITAFPHAVNYWEKDGRRITSSAKHRIEAYDEGDHSLVLSLRIHDIDQSDYGEYRCVASNTLGTDHETMYLYEYTEPDDKKVTESSVSSWSSRLTHLPIYSLPYKTLHEIPEIRSYTQSAIKIHRPSKVDPISERVGLQNGSQHHVTLSKWLPFCVVCFAFRQLTCRE